MVVFTDIPIFSFLTWTWLCVRSCWVTFQHSRGLSKSLSTFLLLQLAGLIHGCRREVLGHTGKNWEHSAQSLYPHITSGKAAQAARLVRMCTWWGALFSLNLCQCPLATWSGAFGLGRCYHKWPDGECGPLGTSGDQLLSCICHQASFPRVTCKLSHLSATVQAEDLAGDEKQLWGRRGAILRRFAPSVFLPPPLCPCLLGQICSTFRACTSYSLTPTQSSPKFKVLSGLLWATLICYHSYYCWILSKVLWNRKTSFLVAKPSSPHALINFPSSPW